MYKDIEKGAACPQCKLWPNAKKPEYKCKCYFGEDKFYCGMCKEIKEGTHKAKDARKTSCKECNNAVKTRKRKALKIKAVEYKGSKCLDCNFSGNIAAFEFHHLDPSQKDFEIGQKFNWSDSVQKELDKCVLLCANCHRIRHSV